MNNEKMPVNLYTLDIEESMGEVTEAEWEEQKKEACKPWIFSIGVCVIMCMILAFINHKTPQAANIFAWVALYLLLLCQVILSIFKINKIKKS